MCDICESDKRAIWGPSKKELNLELVDHGNWISLMKCPSCGTHWVYSPYEPYASYPYWVKWTKSPNFWQELAAIEEGEVMRNWHMLQIKKLWSTLPANEKKTVEAHRKRTYNSHNPVDLPVDSQKVIRKFNDAYKNFMQE